MKSPQTVRTLCQKLKDELHIYLQKIDQSRRSAVTMVTENRTNTSPVSLHFKQYSNYTAAAVTMATTGLPRRKA